MKAPRLSVLMPLRNAATHLAEALDSLWAQDFRDFEVLAVDDHSSDATWALLQAAAKKEPRLRPLRKRGRPGLVPALNFALSRARGAFLARMDGDDRSHGRRFASQWARFEAEAGLGVLGSAIRLWRGRSLTVEKKPLSHEAIAARLAFENPLAHPSVMLRRSALGPARYAEGWTAAEDYELWTRLAQRTRLANLAEPLLDYRVHPQQSGAAQGLAQYAATSRLRLAYLRRRGLRPGPRQAEALAAVCPPFPRREAALLPAVRDSLSWLLQAAEKKGAFDPPALLAEVRLRFAAYCFGVGPRGALYYAREGGALRSKAAWSRTALRAAAKGLLAWR